MSAKFQTYANGVTTDFATAEEAAIECERHGGGSVVQFRGSPNMPGCLPAVVWSSLAMWSYDAERALSWQRHSIHDGIGGPLGEERPGSDAIEQRRLARNPWVCEVFATAGYWNEMGRYPSRWAAERAAEKYAKLSKHKYRARNIADPI